MPKISVIVPVYNSEQYLCRCLDSILNQDFDDFELLLIDDGSNDTSGKICDRYILKDDRVRVFHKNNGGVSSARNLGLDKATGEWIAFIDSDDYVDNLYLSHLVAYTEQSAQIIICGYKVEGRGIQHKLEKIILSGESFIRYLIENKTIFDSQPWAKLYCAEVIKKHSIRFPIGVNIGEDAIFNIKYYCFIDCFCQIEAVDYHYELSNVHSLTHRISPFPVEWHTFIVRKEALLELLTRYAIFTDIDEVLWNYGVGTQFVRCLRSIYDKRNNYGLRSQISMLTGIPKEVYRDYNKYYRCTIKKQAINKFLVSERLFLLFFVFNKYYKNGC